MSGEHPSDGIGTDEQPPKRKRNNFIRLGIKYGQAYTWSRTRKGEWAVAQSPTMKTSITISRLKKRAYESKLD